MVQIILTLLQKLMNVQLIMEDVSIRVLTLRALSDAPVLLDTLWQQIILIALVRVREGRKRGQ